MVITADRYVGQWDEEDRCRNCQGSGPEGAMQSTYSGPFESESWAYHNGEWIKASIYDNLLRYHVDHYYDEGYDRRSLFTSDPQSGEFGERFMRYGVQRYGPYVFGPDGQRSPFVAGDAIEAADDITFVAVDGTIVLLRAGVRQIARAGATELIDGGEDAVATRLLPAPESASRKMLPAPVNRRMALLPPANTAKVPWINFSDLPLEEQNAVLNTIQLIDNGSKPSGKLARKWATTFRNADGDLPGSPGGGGYSEYRVAPGPGEKGAGARRIVVNRTDGAVYYTWTHYGDNGTPAFVRVR